MFGRGRTTVDTCRKGMLGFVLAGVSFWAGYSMSLGLRFLVGGE